MAAGLDASAVLRALADHPDAFPAVRTDAVEFARKALVKQLKDKSLTAPLLRRICEAGGEAALSAVLDGWTATEVVALVRKADANSAHAKVGGDEAAARRHVVALATGATVITEKTAKAERPAKAAKAPASKIGGVLRSKVHGGGERTARAKKKP